MLGTVKKMLWTTSTWKFRKNTSQKHQKLVLVKNILYNYILDPAIKD